MGGSRSAPERVRSARRSGIQFLIAVTATGVVLVGGFGVVMAAAAHSVSRLGSSFADMASDSGPNSIPPAVRPIPIDQSACPSLRLVAAATLAAEGPWTQILSGSLTWSRFTVELSAPLAALDAALGAAVPRVPGPVATDLRQARRDVETGRLRLPSSSSITEYMSQSGVLEGYAEILHASELVGSGCGVTIAPPLSI